MFTIRPFQPSDAEYEAIVAVHNLDWPEDPAVVSAWKHNDETRNRDYLFQRFVAELDGKIIVEGAYLQPFWSYKPGKYQYGYSIDPAYKDMQYEGQSLHMQILNYVLDALAEHGATILCTGTMEDKTDRMQFLKENGFRFKMRYPHSELDLTTFDFARFAGADEKVAAQGIEIVPLPQYQAREPEWMQKLYDMCWELEQDVPSPDPPTREPLEEFAKTFSRPAFCAEGWFIALDQEQPVGVSMLGLSAARPEKMYTWLTGVLRSHRRRGIATAMKLRTLTFAQGRGVRVIETGNEENNPMYDLNLALGFKPKPAWIDFEKRLQEK